MSMDHPPRETSSLADTTRNLGENYADWKHYEAEKNADKDRFYELADEELAKESVGEKLVYMAFCEGDTEGDVLNRIRRFNPGWEISEYRPAGEHEGDSGFEAILEEDISLKPFTYVNRELDPPMVFKRGVSRGSLNLDDTYLQRDDPMMWDLISYQAPWSEDPGDRLVPPLDTLEPSDAQALSKYMYYGKPSVKLVAPREAKDDE